MTRNILIALSLTLAPGMALAEGCGSFGHYPASTVAEVEPVQTPIPVMETQPEATLVASIPSCTALVGDALVTCLAEQANN